MKGAYLIFKCRNCGGLVKQVHVSNWMDVFVHIERMGHFSSQFGSVYPLDYHHCGNGVIGVTDLIAFEEDKDGVER